MRLEFTLKDFEAWLRERGYDKRMGNENFELFLNIGFAGLLFMNSSLLMSFILSKMGLPSERFSEKVRFEVGKRVKEIKASREMLEITINHNQKT